MSGRAWRNKKRYLVDLENLEVNFGCQPAGNRFALKSGRLEAVLADGLECFFVEASRSGAIFIVGKALGSRLRDLGITDGAVSVDNELYCCDSGELPFSRLLAEFGLDGEYELRKRDFFAYMIDAF